VILVDHLRAYPASMTVGLPGRLWCHMVSDLDAEELHAFAARLGLRRAWFQERPKASVAHYDLTPRRRARAIGMGATIVTVRELVRRNFDRIVRR